MPSAPKRRHILFIGLGLVIFTLAAFWGVQKNGFINYDDPLYVTDNPRVQNGLTSEGIAWAFRSSQTGNWHPVTWLSHMLDAQLFGPNNAAKHHLTSVLLHAANALLLFLFLHKITGAAWRSAFAAALFAAHPLRVESVAWVSERKDVLSTFFWVLSMWAYVRYAQLNTQNIKLKADSSRAARWFAMSLLCFALGLMSKPMLVTLPFVLLLLDFWPLQRISNFKLETKTNASFSARQLSALIVEKWPFFVVTAVFCFVTVWAQKSEGSVRTLTELSLSSRMDNAVVSYFRYLGKIFWPENLAVFYPHPKSWPGWLVLSCAAGLVIITMAAGRVARRWPYLTFGWFWYLGTLVPVIGLVQVGIQSMADRYTYVPMIGINIVIAWGLHALLARWPMHRVALAGGAGVVLVACFGLTRAQVVEWRNSETLFRHALRVTDGNYTAHASLGIALAEKGQLAEAEDQFRKGLAVYPGLAEGHHNLGNALLNQGRPEEARPHYIEAIRLNPNYVEAHMNLGLVSVRQRDMEAAKIAYARVVELRPDNVVGHHNLATAYLETGDLVKAAHHYALALRASPGYVPSLFQLGMIAMRQGNTVEAAGRFNEVLRFEPDHAEARSQLQQLQTVSR